MTRSTIKRNLQIGLVPYSLPLPNSASTHQKIIPRNMRAILPKIARIHPISPTTIKQRWEPRRNIVGLTLAVNLLAVNLLAVNLQTLSPLCASSQRGLFAGRRGHQDWDPVVYRSALHTPLTLPLGQGCIF